MIRSHETPGNPIQPQGWPIYSHTNIANQARQEADRQRARVDQLTRRNRRLRAVTASALAISVIGMGAMLGLGLIVGYAFGTGLLGWVAR